MNKYLWYYAIKKFGNDLLMFIPFLNKSTSGSFVSSLFNKAYFIITNKMT